MKAIILAAGAGHRMGELVKDTNKVLLPIHDGKGTLDLQIEALREVNLKDKEITIVVGYKKDQITKRYPGCDYIQNDKYEDHNNSYSLHLAGDRLKNGAFLLNGDVVYLNLPRLLRRMLRLSISSIAVIKKSCDEEDMKVAVKDGHIRKIGKDIPPEEIFGEYIGIAHFDKYGGDKLNTELSQTDWRDWYEKAIQTLIDTLGMRIVPCPAYGTLYWEIDTKEDLEEAIKGYVT